MLLYSRVLFYHRLEQYNPGFRLEKVLLRVCWIEFLPGQVHRQVAEGMQVGHDLTGQGQCCLFFVG